MDDLHLRDDGPVGRSGPDPEPSAFTVKPVPPFRLDHTVRALQRRAINAVDRFDGSTYRRILVVGGRPLEVEVAQIAPPERPALRVTVGGAAPAPGVRSGVMPALTRLLGLDRRLAEFYRAAARDPVLGPLAQAFCGLKPPRFATPFEALLNAFACQQVTLSLGIELLNRLAAACAPGADGSGARACAFPSPEDLAGRDPDQLRALGFSRQKAQAIIELARAIAAGRLDLSELEHLDDDDAVARLRALRGVGRWSAEYVLLRGLGRLHVFPGDDVGARNNLQRWLGLLEPLDYEGVQRTLAKWAPFQGLVYLHLLLRGLQLKSESRPRPTPRMGQSGHGALR
jgi:DNA-3-methyladenine glycosylase II